MKNNIAILCGDKDTLCSLDEVQTITIWEQQALSGWQKRKIFPFQIAPAVSMEALRNQIRNLITMLDDCKIIAGLSITGLAYHVFDRMGFRIFEISALQEDTFDKILADIKQSDDISAATPVPTAPIALSDGVYHLDLIQLQEHFPDISSKKALQSFLHDTPFIRLNLLCSHLPLWLKTPEYTKEFSIRTKKYGNGLMAAISKKTCIDREELK